MRIKLLVILLVVICSISCVACNVLGIASQSSAMQTSKNVYNVIFSLNPDYSEYEMYVCTCNDNEIAYVYHFHKGKQTLFSDPLPLVDADDLVFTNPDPSRVENIYDYSASQHIATNEDVVKNMFVLIIME